MDENGKRSLSENRLSILKRDEKIIRLALTDATHERIAHEVGLDRRTVSGIIDRCRKEWAKTRLADTEELAGRELARIAEIERLAHEGFQKSLAGNRWGDARYIQTMLAAVERRCAILGIDKPTKVDLGEFFSGSTAAQELKDAGVKTPEEATAFLARVLAEGKPGAPGSDVN